MTGLPRSAPPVNCIVRDVSRGAAAGRSYHVPVSGSAGVVPFVGRTSELAALRERLRGATLGLASITIVEGEPGIGKTRLLDEVLSRAGALGVTVLRASGHEMERNRPFGMMVDALGIAASSTDDGRATVAGLLWGGTALAADVAAALTGRSALQYRALEAVLALVDSCATAAPMVLVMEDLQWADPSTLLTLHTLRSRLPRVPVTVLATRRPSPKSDALEQVVAGLQSDGGGRIVLGPLGPDDTDALTASVVGATPGASLQAQLIRTNGNPFYVIELLRAFADDGAFHLSDGHAEVGGAGLPPDLRLTLLRRLSYLSSSALEALRMAAVLGTSFDVAHLSIVSAGSAIDLVAPLSEAMAAGVLEETGARLAFRHDLLREALYLDLAAPLRASLHLQVGRALAAAGVNAVLVAEHLALGATTGDGQAVAWLHDAARLTMPQAPGSAVDLLGRALEIAGHQDHARYGLLVDLATASLWSGRITEAEALCRETLAVAGDSASQTALRLGLIQALLAQGKTMAAFTEIQAAIGAAELTGSASAQLGAWVAFGQILTNNLVAGAAAAAAAVDRATSANDDLAVCMALSARSLLASYEHRLVDAIADARAAVDRAHRSPDRTASQLHSHMFLAIALTEADQFTEAASAIRTGRQLSQDVGSDWNLPFYHWTSAALCFFAGDWDDAIAEAETGLLLAREVQSHFGEVGMNCMLSLISSHRNDLRGARQLLARARADLAATGPQHHSDWVGWLEAKVAERAGDDGAALVALGRAWESCAGQGLAWDLPILGPDLVRLCRRTGDTDRARSVTVGVEQVASRAVTPSTRGAALWCRGLVDDDTDVLVEAVTVLRAGPRPLERSLAAEDAAGALARAGRTDEAVAFLDEALDGFTRLHAGQDVARANAGLRELGVSRGRAGPRAGRSQPGWGSLTPTESSVVSLVAEGLANREVADRLYVSHRTVETHLRHVFDKLGVTSRRQLRDQALRRAVAVPDPRTRPTTPARDRAKR